MDVRVAFNVASSRDEALIGNLNVSTNERRRYNPRGALNQCSLTHPNAGLYLSAFRAEMAA